MLLTLYFLFMDPDGYGPMLINRGFSMAIAFAIFKKARI